MDDFKFFEYGKENFHVFLTRAVEFVKNKIPAPDAQFVSVLSNGLDDLHIYAEEKKADFCYRLSNFSEFSVLETEVAANKIRMVLEGNEITRRDCFKKKWKEGVWTFPTKGKNVHVVNLPYFSCWYDDIYSVNNSFLICADEATAKQFMADYNQAKWQRNRSRSCVLGYGGERMENFRKMQWENIYLANNLAQEIRGEIHTFFKSEKAYKEHGLDWKRGILLAGKPGNGKTTLSRAIATDSPVPVIYCALDDDDMFHILERVERTIRSNCPCICILEDADTLASNAALRSALLNMLDGLFSAEGVLTVASTNCPEKMDEAFTGRPSRFDSYYIIGDPEPAECLKILQARLGERAKKLPDGALLKLSENMNGLSAACVQEVAVCALLNCLKTGKTLNTGMLEEGLEKIKKHMRASEAGLEKVTRGSIGFGETKRGYGDF